jgi:hypothetical protein
MVTGLPMLVKANPARIRAPGASFPTVGANSRYVIDEYTIEGTSERLKRDAKGKELPGR